MQDFPDDEAHPLPPPAGRLAWALLGMVAALLALVGFVLPLFPGPPFAILAALCFANVSTRMHDRLARMPSMRGAMGHWQRARRRGWSVQLATAGWLTLLGLVETVRAAVDFVVRPLRRS
ncbi:MAG: DUF454 family protein [Gammaproteobacteria bacterium]|nr:DUF454 family protein [Gammaproteobacteria bacterium]